MGCRVERGGRAVAGGLRRARQGKGDAGIRRGARQSDFGAIPDPAGDSGRTDQQRQRVLFAEKGDARVAAGDVGEHTRQQFYAVQRGAVVAHRDLVLAAAVAELEQRLRQASARHTTQILYIKCLARQIAHALPLPRTDNRRCGSCEKEHAANFDARRSVRCESCRLIRLMWQSRCNSTVRCHRATILHHCVAV